MLRTLALFAAVAYASAFSVAPVSSQIHFYLIHADDVLLLAASLVISIRGLF